MTVDTADMNAYSPEETLPDMYNVLFVTKEKLGDYEFKMLHCGIFMFNEQCFVSNGIRHKEKVTHYTMFHLK